MPNFKIGDLVWAKMKGFPKWPGVVAEPTAELRGTKKTNHYSIFFFGSNNYAWIEPKGVESYIAPTESKTKTNGFKDALAAIERYKITGEGGPPKLGQPSSDAAFDQLLTDSNEPTTSSDKKVKKTSAKKRRLSKDDSGAASSDGESSAKSLKLKGARKSTDTPRGRPPKKSSIGSSSLQKKAKKSEYAADTTTDSSSRLLVSRSKNLIDKPAYINRPESPVLDLSTPSAAFLSKNIVPSNKVFGFIGLGIMGSGIVKNLLISKHQVHVWDRNPDRAEQFGKAGAVVAQTPADVMCAADVVFTCVSDSDAVKSMVLGNCGVLPEVHLGKAYVEMSGVDPETSVMISTKIMESGGRYLEAQIQGSRTEADDGTLLILAAGDRSVFNEIGSVFEAIARASFFVGDVGKAIKMNLAIQHLTGIFLAGLAETMALAERSSVSITDLLDVLNVHSLCSPMLLEKGGCMVECNFPACLPLKHMQKDMSLSLQLAESMDHPIPIGSIVHEAFKYAKRIGYGEHDSSAVYVSARY